MTRISWRAPHRSAVALALVAGGALVAPGCGLLAPLDPLNEGTGAGGGLNTGGEGTGGNKIASPGGSAGAQNQGQGGLGAAGRGTAGRDPGAGGFGGSAPGGAGAGGEADGGDGGASGDGVGGSGAGSGGAGSGGGGAGAGGQGPTVTAIAMGTYNVCAIVGGLIRCWGSLEALGDGRPPRAGTPFDRPVTVLDIDDAVDVALGREFACALRADTTVMCWGLGDDGQLGDGIFHRDEQGVEVAVGRPQSVPGLTGVVDVAAGADHACALLESGRIKCWGSDQVGQLGDEDAHELEPFGSATPVDVPGVTNAVQISAQGSQSCALLEDESVVCWGTPAVSVFVAEPTPTLVPDATNVANVTCGTNHACVLGSDGSASCWGMGNYGELGTGDYMPRDRASAVNGVEDVIQLAGAFYHTCALLSDRSARCWGHGDFGELGDGIFHMSPILDIVRVNLTGIDEIVASGFRTCARVNGSRIYCWGNGELGTLGDDTLHESATPVEIHGVLP